MSLFINSCSCRTLFVGVWLHLFWKPRLLLYPATFFHSLSSLLFQSLIFFFPKLCLWKWTLCPFFRKIHSLKANLKQQHYYLNHIYLWCDRVGHFFISNFFFNEEHCSMPKWNVFKCCIEGKVMYTFSYTVGLFDLLDCLIYYSELFGQIVLSYSYVALESLIFFCELVVPSGLSCEH